MPYLEGGPFGLAGAIVAAALWVLVAFVLPVFLPMWTSRLRGGSGVGAASSGSGSVLIATLIGFVIGVVCGLRR